MRIIGIQPDKAATTEAEFGVGSMGMDDDSNVYIYCQAGAACGQYDACEISGGNEISPTDNGGVRGTRIGVPQVAVADDSYAWVQVYGAGRVNVKASAAANTLLYTHASAGHLEDAETASNASDVAERILLTTARAASDGDAPCFMHWPAIGA